MYVATILYISHSSGLGEGVKSEPTPGENSHSGPPGVPTSLQNLTYTYDDVGNVASVTDGVAGETLNYTYDELDRLTAVSGGLSESYTYNAIGNPLSKGTVSYT